MYDMHNISRILPIISLFNQSKTGKIYIFEQIVFLFQNNSAIFLDYFIRLPLLIDI